MSISTLFLHFAFAGNGPLLMHHCLHCLLKKFPYDLDYIDLSRDEFLDCRNGEPPRYRDDAVEEVSIC